jgi:hypothetical protein
MGLFSSKRPFYNGSDRYARDVVCFSDEFLTAAGKSSPRPEEQFNAILSLTVTILGYSLHKHVRLKDFDGVAIAVEIRGVLGQLSVNPEVLSQNEVELNNLLRHLELKLKKSSVYPGDLVAGILLQSRLEQFINGSRDADIVAFGGCACDYTLLTIKAYRQEPIARWQLGILFGDFLLGAMGHGYVTAKR